MDRRVERFARKVRPEFIGKTVNVCLRCGGPAVSFDSKLEARYYFDILQPLQKAGVVRNIEFHPVFRVTKKVKVKADFAFEEKDGGGSWKKRVIDVKAMKRPLTKAFKRNQNLARDILGVEIEVVRHK